MNDRFGETAPLVRTTVMGAKQSLMEKGDSFETGAMWRSVVLDAGPATGEPRIGTGALATLE
jgi:hypothetical protein